MPLSMPPPPTSKRRFRKLLFVAVVVALGICFLVFRTNRTTLLENPRKVRVEAAVVAPYDGTVGEVFARPGTNDLPAGAPLFSYDVAAMREELGAVEAHADALARGLPPAARTLAGTPGAVSAAMQERNLAAAQNKETAARLNLEAVSERSAQAGVQVEKLRIRLSRGEGTKTEMAQALARRDEARVRLVRPDTGEAREAAATVSAVSPEGRGSLVVVTLSGEPGIYEAVVLTPESDLRVSIER